MLSAPKPRDKINIADVVLSTNHVTFLTYRFPRLISLPTSTIFVSGTSGITAIFKYRSVNPIYYYYYYYYLFSTEQITLRESYLFIYTVQIL